MRRRKDARERGEGAAEPGVERELKFLADRATLKSALAAPFLGGETGAPTWRKLRSVYFDDDDGDLSRAEVALRLRRSEDGWVIGLKRAASGDRGAFEREEIEAAAPSGAPDLSLFEDAVAREVTDLTNGKPLAPRFGSDIHRATRTIEAAGASIEVAFDEGHLFAGDKRAATAEIELELKSGAEAALFDLGLELVEAFPVRLGVASKAARAHALMTGEAPQPVYAEDPMLRPDMRVEAAIAAVMRNCLAHFLGNLPALEAGDRVEAVHQMRVAMRRLRSALELFARAFACAEFDALRAESQRIAARLGEARDWDVFVVRLKTGPLRRFAAEPGFDRLTHAAEAKAEDGHTAIARLAGDKPIARFALRLERLAAACGWREGLDESALAALDEPVEPFAARWLEALHHRVKRRGRRFGSLTPEKRHALRIAMKHMRYATEFFGGLFPEKSADRYADKAAALQDALGELNDATIALRLVKALDLTADAKTASAAGIVTGWCARTAEGDAVALKKDWRAFAKARPFWRDDGKNGRDAD